MSDYLKQKNKKNNIKLQNLLKELPPFCDEFFLGIEQTTTILTRINYAYDLKVFFYFLINELENFKNLSIYELKISDLDNIISSDIEYFLKYLSYFKYYDKECINSEKAKARKLSAVRRMFQYFFYKNEIKANMKWNMVIN